MRLLRDLMFLWLLFCRQIFIRLSFGTWLCLFCSIILASILVAVELVNLSCGLGVPFLLWSYVLFFSVRFVQGLV